MADIVAEGIAVLITRFAGRAPWEARYGYSRVVVAGDWALTAGTTATGLDGVLHPVIHTGRPCQPSRLRSRLCRQPEWHWSRWYVPGYMSSTSHRKPRSGAHTKNCSATFDR